MGRLVKSFGHVLPREVLDARAEAETIRTVARLDAEKLLASARADADEIRRAARAQGASEGRAEAEAAFTTLLVEARADAERVNAAALSSARTLAVRMAEKIIGRAVQTDPAALIEIAAAALAETRTRAGIVLLRVHPEDKMAMEAARPQLSARLAQAVELRVVVDPTVGRGGCIVEAPTVRLDARLENQLAALERAAFGAATGRERVGRDG